MFKSLRILLITASLSCVLGHTATIETARGTVEITDQPQSIAVLDVGVMDTLSALGVDIKGVPNDTLVYTNRFNKADATKVGTFFEPDLEALSALNPDLIIIAQRSAPKYDAVKPIATTIDLTLDAKNIYTGMITRMENLSALFNKEDEAKTWIAKLNQLRDKIRNESKNQGKILIILTSGQKVALMGNSTRLNWLHQELGLDTVDDNAKASSGHGIPISFEFIAKTNPDWIFVIDRATAINADLPPAKSVLDNDLVNNTKAAKNGHILYLNPANNYVDVGGPNAIFETLTEIDQAFNQ